MNSPTTPLGQPVGTQKPNSAWREILSTIAILGTALLTAFFIISFVFRSYQVDGPSMERTLQNADKLIIWKVPRSWAKVTGHDYIPNRGDIIVFSQKGLSEYGDQNDKQLIKRVVALPGERVSVQDGEIIVYNQQNPAGFKPDRTLEYGKDIPRTTGQYNGKLKEHELFVVGDNRADSLDSRSFGPIDADQVIGKLMIRVFPVDQAKVF